MQRCRCPASPHPPLLGGSPCSSTPFAQAPEAAGRPPSSLQRLQAGKGGLTLAFLPHLGSSHPAKKPLSASGTAQGHSQPEGEGRACRHLLTHYSLAGSVHCGEVTSLVLPLPPRSFLPGNRGLCRARGLAGPQSRSWDTGMPTPTVFPLLWVGIAVLLDPAALPRPAVGQRRAGWCTPAAPWAGVGRGFAPWCLSSERRLLAS